MTLDTQSSSELHRAVPAARGQFERDGFCLVAPLLETALLGRVAEHMDKVMYGDYETSVPPMPMWKPGMDEHMIRKIDQAHLCDRTLWELATHPEIGRWAAAVTGAEMVKLWAVQMLYKPAGGGNTGNIGWHQDQQYWLPWWEEGSELFTAWVAISDVTAEAGPMNFVRGSHQWGFMNEGNFFDQDFQRDDISVPEGQVWDEVPAILPPGGVSYHHRLTYHGSGPNISNGPRRSFALHLCTEKARPLAGCDHYYAINADNPEISPVIYRK